MKRGDVVLIRYPHPSGARGKKRPAVVIQADGYSAVVSTVVLAEITTNLTMATDPACLFLDVSTPEGRATGVLNDSVVSCLLLATLHVSDAARTIGCLSPGMMLRLDGCLRAALGLP